MALAGFLADPRDEFSLTRFQFPSKVGGKPAWLNPENLPSPSEVSCAECEGEMSFLLQVYAPRDELKDSFHRALFVFACRECKNIFRVFRCQLPRENKYYPSEVKEEPVTSDTFALLCCDVCGLPNTTNGMQLVHRRCHNKSLACFSEYELEIAFDEDDHADYSREKQLLSNYEAEMASDPNAGLTESEQRDWEEICNENLKSDPTFLKFVSKCRANEGQVVRYERGGDPLWFCSTDCLDPALVPRCENCGSAREFEFQILPSIVFELKTDRLDFGAVCVFTCSASCASAPTYCHEFLYCQREP